MRNNHTPTHPGGMTATERAKRTAYRIAYAAAAVLLTAAAVAYFTAILILFN